jgi:hypothetical protein
MLRLSVKPSCGVATPQASSAFIATRVHPIIAMFKGKKRNREACHQHAATCHSMRTELSLQTTTDWL